MEQLHTARRSASHGALNRRYGATPGLHPFSRPLRSVNENTSLLPSPGALESMLKTTTETGDIGLFSIKPVKSSSSFRGSFRNRPVDTTGSFTRGSLSDGGGFYNYRDDRRRLPSHRDTTSEIISLYGYDSQRSPSSSLSPPFNDGYRSYSMTSCSSRPLQRQRSTRALQSQRNGGLLQRPRSPYPYPTRLKRPGVRPSSPALTENGAIDYSRMVEIDRLSPRTVHGSYRPTYPKHRRPSASVLAQLDTNRSGSSLSSYGATTRSQLCGAPVKGSQVAWAGRFPNRHGSGTSEQSLRTMSLTSLVDMYQPPPSGPPVAQRRGFHPQPAGTFYYDYSEDFDNNSESVAVSSGPLAPIPTRAPSMHRPRVLSEGSNVRFMESSDQDCTEGPQISSSGSVRRYPARAVAFHDPTNHFNTDKPGNSETHRTFAFPEVPGAGLGIPNTGSIEPELEAYHLPPPLNNKRGSIHDRFGSDFSVYSTDQMSEASNVFRHHVDVEISSTMARTVRLVAEVNNTNIHQEGHTLPSEFNPTDCSEGGDYERPLQTPPDQSSPETFETRQPLPTGCSMNTKPGGATLSSYMRRSKFYSIEPGLSDLASLVQCLDNAARTNFPDTSDMSWSPTNPPPNTSSRSSHEFPGQDAVDQPQQVNAVVHPEEENESREECGVETWEFRGHRRNFAIPRICTSQLELALKPDLSPSVNISTTPILAPQPISPARKLRLQNSVPELMKALPPLPWGSTRSESFVAHLSTSKHDLPSRLPPFDSPMASTACSVVSSKYLVVETRDGGNEQGLNLESHTSDTRATNGNHQIKKTGLEHILAPSFGDALAHVDRVSLDGSDTSSMPPAHDKANSPGNDRLKLRVSRGAMVRAHGDCGKSGRHLIKTASPSKSNDSSEGRRHASQCESPMSTQAVSRCGSKTHKDDTGPEGQENAFVWSSTPSAVVHSTQTIHRKPCPFDNTGAATQAVPSDQVQHDNVRGSLSDTSTISGISSRGLKKRMSDIRVRLAESRLRPAEPQTTKKESKVEIESDVATSTVLSMSLYPETGGSSEESQHTTEPNILPRLQSRGFRNRMGRWIRTCRQAVIVACTGPRKEE